MKPDKIRNSFIICELILIILAPALMSQSQNAMKLFDTLHELVEQKNYWLTKKAELKRKLSEASDAITSLEQQLYNNPSFFTELRLSRIRSKTMTLVKKTQQYDAKIQEVQGQIETLRAKLFEQYEQQVNRLQGELRELTNAQKEAQSASEQGKMKRFREELRFWQQMRAEVDILVPLEIEQRDFMLKPNASDDQEELTVKLTYLREQKQRLLDLATHIDHRLDELQTEKGMVDIYKSWIEDTSFHQDTLTPPSTVIISGEITSTASPLSQSESTQPMIQKDELDTKINSETSSEPLTAQGTESFDYVASPDEFTNTQQLASEINTLRSRQKLLNEQLSTLDESIALFESCISQEGHEKVH